MKKNIFINIDTQIKAGLQSLQVILKNLKKIDNKTLKGKHKYKSLW